MQLILPIELRIQVEAALRKAGNNEIGGILMAEHVGENSFHIRSLTIQKRGGTFATFVRYVEAFLVPLRRFFQRTNHDYRRYNYIGEWHSHPSFAPVPSRTDDQTMRTIIEDPEVGANFIVLLIVKLNESRGLDGTVTVYIPDGRCFGGNLLFD